MLCSEEENSGWTDKQMDSRPHEYCPAARQNYKPFPTAVHFPNAISLRQHYWPTLVCPTPGGELPLRHATPRHAEGRELPNSACPCPCPGPGPGPPRLCGCLGLGGAKGSVCTNTRGSSIANSLISSGRPINSGQWQLRVFAFSFPNARFLPRVNKQKCTSEKQAGFGPDYSRGFLGHCLGRGGAPRTISGGREQQPFTARQSGGGWSYFYCYCLSTNLPMPNNDVVQSELFAINDSWVQ